MASESKKREVLQLLRDYRTFHSAFGSARSWDDQHVAQAAYGPAGIILAGAEYRDYTRDEVERLAKSYDHLEDALTYLKGDGPLGVTAYTVLLRPYLGAEPDPSVVERWRTTKPLTAEWHDLAVGQLAHYLRHKKLYPIEPKRLSESEEKSIENKNAEIYANFQRLRNSGLSERAAAEQAGEEAKPAVSREYVERLIEFRDTLKPKVCIESGCDRKPERGNLCMKHYMQERRRQERENKNAS